MSAPQRDQPQGMAHLRDRIAEHAARGGLDVHAELLRQPGQRPPRRVGVQLHRAAEEVAGVERPATRFASVSVGSVPPRP